MEPSATISLCMISFNEADMIGDAIRSCAGVVDEIIVVDTGSTDGTPDIARKLGAKVILREWTKNYAEARNAGFHQATKDWVIVLDCDERLEPESAQMLRQVVSKSDAEALTVLIVTEGSGGESTARMVRLGQRATFPPLTRRIHEHPSRPLRSLEHTRLRIRHLGYQRGTSAPKLHRYAELLELQLAETPDDFYIQLDLLHTYWILGDPRWEKWMEIASGNLDRSAPPKFALVAVLLELAMLRDPAKAPGALSAAEAAELSEKWYPDFLPLLGLRLRMALSKRDHGKAIALADHALGVGSTPRVDPVPFKRQYLIADIHLLAGAACVMAGKRDAAIEHFKKAAEHPEITEIARANLQATKAEL